MLFLITSYKATKKAIDLLHTSLCDGDDGSVNDAIHCPVRYDARIASSLALSEVQTNLVGVSCSGDAGSWFAGETGNSGPIGKKPLSHVATILRPATLRVDIARDTDKR